MKKKICDMNCLECSYDDCINDKPEPLSSKERQRIYYQDHKEEVKSKNLKYYREHREQILLKHKQQRYFESRKEYRRNYYLTHREEIQRKERERYWKKKQRNI